MAVALLEVEVGGRGGRRGTGFGRPAVEADGDVPDFGGRSVGRGAYAGGLLPLFLLGVSADFPEGLHRQILVVPAVVENSPLYFIDRFLVDLVLLVDVLVVYIVALVLLAHRVHPFPLRGPSPFRLQMLGGGGRGGEEVFGDVLAREGGGGAWFFGGEVVVLAEGELVSGGGGPLGGGQLLLGVASAFGQEIDPYHFGLLALHLNTSD